MQANERADVAASHLENLSVCYPVQAGLSAVAIKINSDKIGRMVCGDRMRVSASHF